MTRSAKAEAGCPRATAGGVLCVVQWYGVKGVHASEAMKVMNAEGGGDGEIEGARREVGESRVVRVQSIALAGRVFAGGRVAEAVPREAGVAAEGLKSSSLSLRLTGIAAICSRVVAS